LPHRLGLRHRLTASAAQQETGRDPGLIEGNSDPHAALKRRARPTVRLHSGAEDDDGSGVQAAG
jgi:hypothetical protein